MDKIMKNLDLGAQGLWLPIVIAFILLLYIAFMPKKALGWREIYITIGVIGLLTWIANNLFAVFFDLVDFGDKNITGIGEMITYTFIPSSLAVIYLNYINSVKKWLLVLLFIAVSFTIEGTVTAIGYMKQNHWNILYSIPIYFIIFYYYLPWHWKVIKCQR